MSGKAKWNYNLQYFRFRCGNLKGVHMSMVHSISLAGAGNSLIVKPWSLGRGPRPLGRPYHNGHRGPGRIVRLCISQLPMPFSYLLSRARPRWAWVKQWLRPPPGRSIDIHYSARKSGKNIIMKELSARKSTQSPAMCDVRQSKRGGGWWICSDGAS